MDQHLCFPGVLAAVNMKSVKGATRIQDVFTVAKLLALIVLIATGAVLIGMGKLFLKESSGPYICCIIYG